MVNEVAAEKAVDVCPDGKEGLLLPPPTGIIPGCAS
jgi:hypothetical protein